MVGFLLPTALPVGGAENVHACAPLRICGPTSFVAHRHRAHKQRNGEGRRRGGSRRLGQPAPTRMSSEPLVTLADTVITPANELFGNIFLFGIGIIISGFAAAFVVSKLVSSNLGELDDLWEEDQGDVELVGNRGEKMFASFEEEIRRREEQVAQEELDNAARVEKEALVEREARVDMEEPAPE